MILKERPSFEHLRGKSDSNEEGTSLLPSRDVGTHLPCVN